MEQTDKKTAYNSGFALWGLTYFVETFVQGSTFVLRRTVVLKIPHNAKPQTVVICFQQKILRSLTRHKRLCKHNIFVVICFQQKILRSLTRLSRCYWLDHLCCDLLSTKNFALFDTTKNNRIAFIQLL